MESLVVNCLRVVKISLFYFSLAQAQSTFFLKPKDITDTTFTITAPGIYIFTDDVYFSKIGATAITITTDNVVIDLDGRTLRATNPSGENIAINITRANNNQSGATRSNITIRNGFIANFNVSSVRVDLGSSHITLENLTILSSNIRATVLGPNGILLDGLIPIGLKVTNRTTDVTIKNCFVDNSRFGLRARNADNVRVINSTFNHNGSRGISAIDCNAWELTNCQAAQQQVSDELGNFGLLLQGGNAWRVKNCDFSFNTITSPPPPSVFFAFPPVGGAQFQTLFVAVRQESGGHSIENCTFNNNTTTIPGIVGRGLALVSSDSCVVRNCIANGNATFDSGVFGFAAGSEHGNLFENCLAAGNYAQLPTLFGTIGFSVQNSIGTCLIGCAAKRNFEPVFGFGGGFFIDGLSSNCLVQNCLAVANSTEGFLNGSATSVFVGNLAFANPFNYVAFAPLGFITVLNGTQPPALTFDERKIDNISIV